MDEEKQQLGIDDTGDEPVIDLRATPPVEEEPQKETEGTEEVEGKEGEEGKEEGDKENWEERYKNLQSFSDKKISDLQRYERLVSPFGKHIKEAGGGELTFEFPETSKKPEDAPQPPTDEDWETNPKEAAEKLVNYKEHLRDQKLNENRVKEHNAEVATKAEEDYKSKREDTWKKTQEMFPDVTNQDSALFKRATAILNEDPKLALSPFCDLRAVKEAAYDLGIKLVNPDKPVKPKSKDNASYIIGGKGGSAGSKGKADMSDDDFYKLPDEQQREIMRKQVLDKT